MDGANLYDEAENCRLKALSYLGKPEAPFLLHVAQEFDRLAAKRMGDRSKGRAYGAPH
jgi:hypothetical protein